jgi:hypothetical protein
VAAFTGIGGSFEMEWVAAFGWNRWQLWSGIRTPNGYNVIFIIDNLNSEIVETGGGCQKPLANL